ncbi:hypothetical protein SAMN04487894_11111 [Niabella drilacis]|uniref:Uncharacterized protein n=1 Tax=Niabella drilacis (strain DSM 25811 / CCM 8410 / CCUG 62505 / LMG 26954 / E90) TaxID=1285928 RepID=A0A1G6W5L7_NIADE|nr:hypothetical protein SAMN04487894_11111 [Niabella drilacis]
MYYFFILENNKAAFFSTVSITHIRIKDFDTGTLPVTENRKSIWKLRKSKMIR